jgi:hypothetical protein
MFEQSKNSRLLWKYFNEKYGQVISPVALLKCLSVVSVLNKDKASRVNVICVAPSRQFKTQTSFELMKIFPKSRLLYLGSDFTIHSIYEDYAKRNKANKKCWLINDATLLFASKASRTKARLIDALSELMTEGQYIYGERQESFTIKADVSIVMNMTLNSFCVYEKNLLKNTFLERAFTVFYRLTEEEENMFSREREERVKMKPLKLRLTSAKTVSVDEYTDRIIELARRYSALSLTQYMGCFDRISALIKTHAMLNNRSYVAKDDFQLIEMLFSGRYFVNPMAPNVPRIVELAKLKYSYKDICLLLNQSPETYRPYVTKVINRAKRDGLL